MCSSYDFVSSSFPSTFFLTTSSEDERIELLLNGTCNVIANDRSWLLAETASRADLAGGELIVGEKMMTNEPLAFVTRKNDREFSDIVNWVLQALFLGEEQGLTKDVFLCQNNTMPQVSVSDLNFLNAVFCVGKIFMGSLLLLSCCEKWLSDSQTQKNLFYSLESYLVTPNYFCLPLSPIPD